jgi:periplasmic protein TonB
MASQSLSIPARYRAGPGSRWSGIGGTLAVYGLAGAVLLVSLSTRIAVPPPAVPTVMAIRQQAVPPPRTPPQPKTAPRPMRQAAPRPGLSDPLPAPIVPAIEPLPSPPPKPADPETEAPAPRIVPAQPAPQAASTAPDSWEGRVLLQLSKARRYPDGAMARREQGVPMIRFVMDRQGRVLSASLEHSSGHADLDREALALPRRAQPLPRPPADRPGDTLELVVPVEFSIR